ncbi:hypothetical protein AXFE_27690 [Acidithrix ferrooxidans]|uniref:Uncharacterized protein n=1 Tax=Acidithrix ferrooxidans TaxID=1280514 RepID=A0A0D8HEU7_9ACTN|nr:hypothetical protein AXFE_27690 [Acidithrix ferrooxidans]
MKIGGSYHVWIDQNRDPWPSVAGELNLDTDSVISRAREIVDRISNSFYEVSQRSEVSNLGSSLPSRLVEKVHERSIRCMAVLK